MEIERPWWLYAACGVSLCVHVVVGLTSPSLGQPRMAESPAEIEVALEPLPEPKTEVRPQVKRERWVRVRVRTRREKPQVREHRVKLAVVRPRPVPRLQRPKAPPRLIVKEHPVRAPRLAKAVPHEKPVARTPRTAPAPLLRMAKADLPRLEPQRQPAPPKEAVPDPPREKPVSTVPGERPDPSPRLGSGKQRSLLGGENLFNGLGPKEEKPDLSSRPSGHGENAPLLQRASAGPSSRPLSDAKEGGKRDARPDDQKEAPRLENPGAPTSLKEGPRRGGGTGLVAGGNPLADLGQEKSERPIFAGSPDGPKNRRLRRNRNQLILAGDRPEGAGGGGSSTPAPEGAPNNIRFEPGPSSPEKITVRNNGRGGLSVENLLAKDAMPDEAPGLGATGSGAGAGRELGLGSGRERSSLGAPTDREGPRRSPRGLEADLPPGGSGVGEGGGSGRRAEGGSRSARGGLDLGKDNPLGDTKGDRGGRGVGRGGRLTLGDAGRGELLGGDGAPDGDGREGRGNREHAGGGALPGGRAKEVSGPEARVSKPKNGVHIVYVVDVSPSATFKSKMLKAKASLRKALNELEATDSFTIIDFAGDVRRMSGPLKPNPENIQHAFDYLDSLRPRGNFTDISAAMEDAFAIHPLTHVYLLSDGEASGGISDPDQLRRKVRALNTQKAQILTIALESGPKAFGVPLLRHLAADSDGVFSYLERH